MVASRRLAAIMFTDMVGYTEATQADERASLVLRREQESLVRPVFAAHQGREVKSTGDGFLVEFDSALKATECAVHIQRRLHERNAGGGVTPIRLRIGIHLGDVERQGTDIFGDAVNIAARIEPIAEPGGICLSGAVYEQVRNKIPDSLERLPPTALKGLQVPMDLYRIVLPWTVRESRASGSGPIRVAVLPFTNMSTDPADMYFADGLTEELITVLSQLRELRVIARTSVTPYKSTSKGVSQIGAELRVASLLEGSVRKAGNRLRVTAQLIDVESEGHVWAKSYDREIDDVFAIQAELAKEVASALQIELRTTERARLESRPKVRSDSYLAYLKGRTLFHSFSKASEEAAKEQFELAISLDPGNAAAYSGMADLIERHGPGYVGGSRAQSDAIRRKLVARALEIDPNLAEAHASLGEIEHENYNYDGAERELKLSLSLNPSYSPAHHWFAELLEDRGRVEEALEEWDLAEGADPRAPYHLQHFAQLLLWLGRLDEAQVKIQKLGELEPDSSGYLWYHAMYLHARGDLDGCVKDLHRLEEVGPESQSPQARQLLRAQGHALAGETEQSRAILRNEETRPGPTEFGWDFVCTYGLLGDLDPCFRWIDKAIDTGVVRARWLTLDPIFQTVRRDPRFRAVLKRLNLG